MEYQIKLGDTEPLTLIAIDSTGAAISSLDALISIRNKDMYLDFADYKFKPKEQVEQLQVYVPEKVPGEYSFDLDTKKLIGLKENDVLIVKGDADAPAFPKYGQLKIIESDYRVEQKFGYHEGVFSVMAWAERSGKIFKTPQSCKLAIYISPRDRVTLYSDDSDNRGIFRLSESVELLAGQNYSIETEIILPEIGTITSADGIYGVEL